MLNKRAITVLLAGILPAGALLADTPPKQGGELTVPLISTGFVENFNPYTLGDPLKATMFEPLFIHNSQTGEIEPRLAESIVVADDLMSVTIKMRPNLKWSDGSALTAEDVAFSFNLPKSTPAFDVKGIWSEKGKAKSVSAIDDLTVIIELKEADSTFVWGLKEYHIVPEHTWGEVENLTTFTNPNPVGNGPFTEVALLRPQQLTLCRNPHYWQADKGRPYLDCVVTRSFSDNSQIQAALMKGEIDWGSNFIADIEKTFVKADPENNHYWYPANDATHLYMNTKAAPFDNLSVRKALSMSLDREMIVDLAAYGYPTPNYYLGGLSTYFESYIDKNIEKKFSKNSTYNPDLAMEKLDAAGYIDQNGDGFRQLPNGENINIDIEVVNGWTDWVQTAQLVTEMFEDVGVRSRVKIVDWSVYDKNLKEGTYEMSINWSTTNGAHPIQAYQDYFSEGAVGASWHAGHGIFSQEISDLIANFGRTNDIEEQKRILGSLQQFTAENMPFIPLFASPVWFQYRTEKIVGWPNAENPYILPNYYQADKKAKIIDNLHLK